MQQPIINAVGTQGLRQGVRNIRVILPPPTPITWRPTHGPHRAGAQKLHEAGRSGQSRTGQPGHQLMRQTEPGRGRGSRRAREEREHGNGRRE